MQTATRKAQKRPARERPGHRPLEELLADLVRAHEALTRSARAQREAIRRAEPPAIAAARDEMAGACAAIAALNDERRATAAAMAPGESGATLSRLAASLPEPQRGRAVELAARLRELVLQASGEQRRLQGATESMLRHVRGVVQHMQRSLNHSGVYGRAGRVEPGAAVVSGIDLTR
jgi:hypothetical protein